MPLAAIWIDLQIIILREVYQAEEYKLYMIQLKGRILKNIQMNLSTMQKNVLNVVNELMANRR